MRCSKCGRREPPPINYDYENGVIDGEKKAIELLGWCYSLLLDAAQTIDEEFGGDYLGGNDCEEQLAKIKALVGQAANEVEP